MDKSSKNSSQQRSSQPTDKRSNQRLSERLSQRIANARQRLFDRDSMVKNANTPFDVLYDDGLATLRHYPSSTARYKTPLLIIPPLAVSSKIYDLLENRSFIQYMLTRGFDVYLIDWGKPTRLDSKRGFDYYITQTIPRMIRAVREYSGSQDISLHGWSMGGLFTILHTAYSQDPHIKNLFLVGVPIDSHASGVLGKIINIAHHAHDRIEDMTGYHLNKLPNQVIHTRGWFNMMLFKAVDPLGTGKSYWHLLKNLDDPDALTENATKADFLNNMLDYPGGIIRDTAIDFLLPNDIIKGEFELAGQRINLGDITANLFVIAGKGDTLATSDSVSPIIDHASSTDTTFHEIVGGHVGIVASGITSERTWPVMADWLAERSS